MKNLFVILFALIVGNSFAQKNIYSDMNVHGKTFAKDSLIVEKAMKIGDSLLLSPLDTVYKESLNERDFATSTKWITTGNFSISVGKATFSGTSGTLKQKENKLALTGLGDNKYRFIYTVSNMTGVGCTAFINTDFAISNTNLVLVNATDTLNFTSSSDPTDFKIECTCTSGGFDLDDFSLKVNSDSIVFIKNSLYTGGIFVEGSSAFSGDVQILGNLQGGSPLIISTPIGEIEIDGDIHFIKNAENWTLGVDVADANQFKISNDSILGTNDRLVIDNLGNIGIGTSTPNALLEVIRSSTGEVARISTGGTNLVGSLGFYKNTTTQIGKIEFDGQSDNSFDILATGGSGNPLVLGAAGVEKMRITGTEIAVNETGSDFDFRVEGLTNQKLLFTDATNDRVGIAIADGAIPLYRLDVGNASYFAINGNFAHIIQHNSAASTFWSIAPRNGGDLDIAVTTTDPRPSSGTIGTSNNAISIKTNKDVEFIGNVGIGTTTPDRALEISGTSNNTASARISSFGSGFSSRVEIQRANGTEGTPTAVFAGNQLGQIAYRGYDGTSFADAALIHAVANQNWAVGSHGSRLEFVTILDGTTAFVTRMTIANDGNVGIGTATPDVSLQVVGGIRTRGGAPGVLGVNNNGYAFEGNGGDVDAGMFSSADGQVEFYTNSFERMRIDDNGVSSVGFANKLLNVSTSVFETAVAGTEYHSPNQHGGIFGAIFRRYYAIPDSPGLNKTVEITMGFALTGRIVEVSGISLNEDGNVWQPMPYVDFGSASRNLELQVNSSTSKISLIGGTTQDWKAGGFILLDYTK